MNDTKKPQGKSAAKKRQSPANATEENPAQESAVPQQQERNPAKQQAIKRLLSYAGNSKKFLSLSLVLSALSALVSFVPYIMVFFVMRDVISAVAAKEAVSAKSARTFFISTSLI